MSLVEHKHLYLSICQTGEKNFLFRFFKAELAPISSPIRTSHHKSLSPRWTWTAERYISQDAHFHLIWQFFVSDLLLSTDVTPSDQKAILKGKQLCNITRDDLQGPWPTLHFWATCKCSFLKGGSGHTGWWGLLNTGNAKSISVAGKHHFMTWVAQQMKDLCHAKIPPLHSIAPFRSRLSFLSWLSRPVDA